MNKYARLDATGVVLETCDAAAIATHEPNLASTFVPCPDGVVAGAKRNANGSWVAYVPPVIAPPPLPLLTPMTLYMAFTPAERIAIKASMDPMVQEFWAMYQMSVQLGAMTDPNLVSVQEALTYLAAPKPGGPGILVSVDRIDQIKNGVPQ